MDLTLIAVIQKYCSVLHSLELIHRSGVLAIMMQSQQERVEIRFSETLRFMFRFMVVVYSN